jgi:hypothetical protein
MNDSRDRQFVFSVHMSLYGQRLFEAKVTLRARARCDAGIQEVFKLQWEEPESSGALFQDEQIIAILSLENLVNSTPDGSCRIATRGLLSMSSKVFSGWKVVVVPRSPAVVVWVRTGFRKFFSSPTNLETDS